MASTEVTGEKKPIQDTVDTKQGIEGEEKPVREKLENAAISSQRGSRSPEGSDVDMQPEAANGRPRAPRKRSLEDLKEPDAAVSSLDAPATPSSGTHLRKKTKEQKELETLDKSKSRSGREASNATSSGLDSDVEVATPTSDSERKEPSGGQSPRKKRSAEEMGEAAIHKQKIAATEEAQLARKSLDETRPVLEPTASSAQGNGASTTEKSPASTTTAKPSGSGFTNASVSSPFASFGTAAGASKASGTAGAFTKTGGSGFGSFGGLGAVKSPLSGASTTTQTSEAPKLSFANAESPFTAGSGFGTAGAGGKLSSFASPKGDFSAAPASNKLASFASPGGGDFKAAPGRLSTFAAPGGGDFKSSSGKLGTFASPDGGDLASTSKPKQFGAPSENKEDQGGLDEDAEDDDEEAESTAADDAQSNKPDEEADKNTGPKVPPGEEDEETLFANRAKLYAFADGAWKERGTGVFKLNIHRDSDLYPAPEDYDDFDDAQDSKTKASDDPEAARGAKDASEKSSGGSSKTKTQARFIMRAMATHRIIINAPLFKEMLLGDPQDRSKPPLSKSMVFGAPEEGRLVTYLLKIGREDELLTLYKTVKIVQRRL